MQSQCQKTWQTARGLLASYPFINCDDISRFVFPQPNCCTGAGILAGSGDKASISVLTGLMSHTKLQVSSLPDILPRSFAHTKLQVSSLPDILPRSFVDGGTLAGAVICTLVVLVLVATVAVVLLVIIFRKMHKRKQLERMQLDICAL